MNVRRRPFFSYYGAKFRAAGRYPESKYDTIIEPFAGAAGYSQRHYAKRVILIDKSETVVGAWRYLLGAKESEILRLPLLRKGDVMEDVMRGWPQEALQFIEHWGGQASATKNRVVSAFGAKCWHEGTRAAIARQLKDIRHWEVRLGSYADAPDVEATWFIDPPYDNSAGRHYTMKFNDYPALAEWSRSRKGQVIVCENEGADWLPFEPLFRQQSCRGKGRATHRVEVMWYKED